MQRAFYYTIDPELKLVHTTSSCPEAKVAVKYNYAEKFTVRTPEDAATLDSQNLTACPRCLSEEKRKRANDRRGGYRSPPGFMG